MQTSTRECAERALDQMMHRSFERFGEWDPAEITDVRPR